MIAFSRKNALMWRERLSRQGKSVAVIYGALAPEVRRAEAARFCSGEAQVLVATDAIGMGLNLPIKRVIFTAVSKFDGTEERALGIQELRQIAGRAGRFGLAERGEAAAMDLEGARVLKSALEGPSPAIEGQLSIAPSDRQIEVMSRELERFGPLPLLLAPGSLARALRAQLRSALRPWLRQLRLGGLARRAARLARLR